MLTTGATLEPAVLDALKAAGTKTVYIAGGEGVVSAAKEQALKDAGFTVIRLAGANRYETAAKLAELTPKTSKVMLATGANFADALSGGGLAASLDANLELYAPSTTNVSVPKGTTDAYLLGGPGAIPSTVTLTAK